MRFRHMALFVGSDLRAAEQYYVDLFGFDVLFREGPVEAGDPHTDLWAQLQPDKGWEDADVAEVHIGMVALQHDEIIVALFEGEPTGDRLYTVGFVADSTEIARIAARLSNEVVESRSDGWLAFVDRYGLRWQLSDTAPFEGAGSRGLWLDV